MSSIKATRRSKRNSGPSKRLSDENKMLEELEEDQLSASPFSPPRKKRRTAHKLNVDSAGPSDIEPQVQMDQEHALRQASNKVLARRSMMSSSVTENATANTAEGSYADNNDDFDNDDFSDWELEPFDNDSEEDEADDDSVIEGPDDEDRWADFIPENHPHEHTRPSIDLEELPPMTLEDEECVVRFADRLRIILEDLQAEAKIPGFKAMKRDERPMTLGFWLLLDKVGVDFLLALYLKGIPKQVQAILGKLSFSPDDFSSIPDTCVDENRVGIYGILATSYPDGTTRKCEKYIGSSIKSVSVRTGQHDKISKSLLSDLPAKLRRSVLYSHICQDGVATSFRALAVFEKDDIAPGYLLLLEAIMMIVYDTYQDPGYYHRWNNKLSYEIVEKIRNHAGFPPVNWKGLNSAWPCYQGFYNANAKLQSECKNPACRRMTYPTSERPKGEAVRYCAVSWDPLNGGYTCRSCYRFRFKNNEFPDADKVHRSEQRRVSQQRILRLVPESEYEITRLTAGENAPCYCCKQLESEVSVKESSGFRHHIHPLLPRKLLCVWCWNHLNKDEALPSQAEIDKRFAREALIDAQMKKSRPICSKCGKVEPLPGSGKRRDGKHARFGPSQALMCVACISYARNPKLSGKSRDPKLNIIGEVRRAADELRKQGLPVHCHLCNAIEPKGLVRKWRNQEAGPICGSCRKKSYEKPKQS